MASNDTAALVVALSAQVSKFQKDMDSAKAVADKSVKAIEDRFAAANKVISDKMSSFASNATAQLGTVGGVLSALGPVGLTVAASVGTLALAFSFVSDKAEAFIERAKKVKDAAETAGLTITQFRLLSAAGAKVGLDSEETEGFINKLTVSFDELRQGGGKLFDQLARVDVALVRELAAAKSTAEAIDILSRAYAKLDDQAQRNTLARAIGGRTGMAGGRLLDVVADKGGLGEMEAAAVAAGKAIDEQLTLKVVKLKREVEEINKRTNAIWGNAFSVEVLEQQKRSAEFWERIAIAVVKAANFATSIEGSLPQGTAFARRFRGVDRPYSAGAEPSTLTAEQLQAVGQSRIPAAPSVPLPQARPSGIGGGTGSNSAVDLELMRRWTSLLGEAITPAEQLKLKILELDAAQQKGGVSDQVRARALGAFKAAQEQAAVATRERLGIANEEEIRTQRLAELDQQRAKGYIKSAEEMALAQRIVAREAKLASEAQQVRGSALPGLKQMELDARSLSKQLDTLATSSLNSLGTALADIAIGNVTAAEGFRNLGLQVVRSLTEMIIKMTILAPIAAALQTTLGGAAGGPLSLASFLSIGKNAEGTNNWRGGLTWVGERGPELLNLPRGSQVIPNSVARNAGAGTSLAPTYNIDARGSTMGPEQFKAIIAANNRQMIKLINDGAPARQMRFQQLGT